MVQACYAAVLSPFGLSSVVFGKFSCIFYLFLLVVVSLSCGSFTGSRRPAVESCWLPTGRHRDCVGFAVHVEARCCTHRFACKRWTRYSVPEILEKATGRVPLVQIGGDCALLEWIRAARGLDSIPYVRRSIFLRVR